MKPWKPGAPPRRRRVLLLGRVRRRGDGVLHGAEQPRLVEGLDQEVEGAGAHRLDRAVDRAVGGDDDHPGVRRVAAQASASSSRPSPSGSCRSSSTTCGRTALEVRPRLGEAEGADDLVAGAGQHRLVDHGRARRCPRPEAARSGIPRAPSAGRAPVAREGDGGVDLGRCSAGSRPRRARRRRPGRRR